MFTRLRILLLFIFCLSMAAPVRAQKFSKKIQERKEAREANYFYGASFTLTAGYVHSWMTAADVASSSLLFGQSITAQNTHDGFDIGFIYDQSFSRRWGLQTGLYYVQKGGELWTSYDGGLGYGKVTRDSKSLRSQGVELQIMGRYFVPVSKHSRFSVNAGGDVSKLFKNEGDFDNWDLGITVGAGFDWKHVAVSVNYQPGLYRNVYKNSNTRLNAIYVNVGYRFWRN